MVLLLDDTIINGSRATCYCLAKKHLVEESTERMQCDDP